MNKSKSSSHQLQLTKSKETQIGANLNFSVGDSSYFNLSGGGGLSAAQTKTETKQTTQSEANEGALSEEFQIVDHLKVPPRTKVQAKIITWIVTYEAKTRTKLSIKADHLVPNLVGSISSTFIDRDHLVHGSLTIIIMDDTGNPG